ncbi:MAG: hypothetical protein LBS18_03900, partial [Clostridiales bacterium]|nr:hypothetical protein [Clostridiales bacterium]
ELIVSFPREKSGNVKALMAQQKLEVMNTALQEIAPGLRLAMKVGGQTQPQNKADTQEEEMLRLFGDKLSIQGGEE